MMLENNLIQKCTCGNTTLFTELVINGLDVIKCNECQVIHQKLEGWAKEDYYNFYKTDYHTKYQEEKKVVTYQDRYDHDCVVANKRLASYKFTPMAVGLDIGSSNSAFVHRALTRNLKCIGLEPGENIGDDSLTIRGTLETADLESNHFDFVTMHDSIEHMIDVNFALDKIYKILKFNGQLILDLPDYFIPEGAHHWKRIEHLWFFSQDQLLEILKSYRFKLMKVTTPIPGKLVFFTRKI